MHGFYPEIFPRQICGVRGVWPAMVFVELLAAAGARRSRECHSAGYTRVCGYAAGFGAAIHLVGRDADGPAAAGYRESTVAGGALVCPSGQPIVFPFTLCVAVSFRGGAAGGSAVAGDAHAGSLDSARRGGSGASINRPNNHNWFDVHNIRDGGVPALRMGVVWGVAVLPGAVCGACVSLP